MIAFFNLTPSVYQDLIEADYSNVAFREEFLAEFGKFASFYSADGGAGTDQLFTTSRIIDGAGIWKRFSGLELAEMLADYDDLTISAIMDGMSADTIEAIIQAPDFLDDTDDGARVSQRVWMEINIPRSLVIELDYLLALVVSAGHITTGFFEVVQTTTVLYISTSEEGAVQIFGEGSEDRDELELAHAIRIVLIGESLPFDLKTDHHVYQLVPLSRVSKAISPAAHLLRAK